MPRIADVDLCNLALDQIAQTSISSLNDGSNAASTCARNYNQTVRAVLNSGRWKSARNKVQLAQRTDLKDPSIQQQPNSAYPYPYAFVGGWPPGNQNYSITDDGLESPSGGPYDGNPNMAYAFQLPPDFIRMVAFNEITVTSYPFWQVRQDILWTNQRLAYLEYVRDVAMPGGAGIGVLDPVLIEVIIKGLAARLAWVFQQSQALQKQLKGEYDLMLSRALAIDSRAEKIALRSPYVDSNWIRSRWNSTYN